MDNQTPVTDGQTGSEPVADTLFDLGGPLPTTRVAAGSSRLRSGSPVDEAASVYEKIRLNQVAEQRSE